MIKFHDNSTNIARMKDLLFIIERGRSFESVVEGNITFYQLHVWVAIWCKEQLRGTDPSLLRFRVSENKFRGKKKHGLDGRVDKCSKLHGEGTCSWWLLSVHRRNPVRQKIYKDLLQAWSMYLISTNLAYKWRMVSLIREILIFQFIMLLFENRGKSRLCARDLFCRKVFLGNVYFY